MQVHFERDWFNNTELKRYRKCVGDETREVPDRFLDQLPSTARVVKNGKLVAPERKMGTGVNTEEADIDTLRGALETADAVIDKAEAKREEALDKAAEERRLKLREQRLANLARGREEAKKRKEKLKADLAEMERVDREGEPESEAA